MQNLKTDLHPTELDYRDICPIDGLPPELLAKVENSVRILHFKKNQIIASIAEPAAGLSIVVKGKVRFEQVSPEKGSSHFIGIIKEGEIFGECEIAGQLDHFVNIISHEASEIALIPRETVLACMRSDIDFTLRVSNLLAKKLCLMQHMLCARSMLSIEQYAASMLLYYAFKFGISLPDGKILLDIHLTQEQLACMMGKTRQNIHTLLQDWRSRGLIQYHYGKLTLCNLKELRSLTSGISQNLGVTTW